MRRMVSLLCFLCCCVTSFAQRARYNFDLGWLLATGDYPAASEPGFEDASWKPVTLPHAWNEDYAYRVSIHDQPTAIAWYRKHFRVPPGENGRKVFVEFEGVRQAAEVWLNGHRLGLSENGVMAFGFDLTPYLVAGDNVLAVRTDNSWKYREKAVNDTLQWNNDNFYSNYGGLNKRVWLDVMPPVYQTLPLYSSFGTTGVYLWADGFNLAAHSATIHVESQVRNESASTAQVRLQARVFDATGREIASGQSASMSLTAQRTATLKTGMPGRGLHFWSWGYGYLYRVETTVLLDGKPVDTLNTRTGFRETAFHNGMIFLNGRVMEVHGYAARSTNEWPALGTDVPPWVSDFSNGLMVADNADLVRWMHVTPSKQDVESTDRVGLPVSMPAGDAEGDSKGRQWQARLELMRDSMVYNRNNPSILFYESGNKGVSEEHMRDMLALRNEFDPHGGRASGSREMLSSHTAEYGGEMLYIDKSATKPLWAHEYNRDEGARKFWNGETPPFHQDSPLYNRNQDSFTLEDLYRWDDYYRERPGTGTRVSAGGVNISWIDENSHFRGDNNYRRSGEVDAMRIPKDAFYAHQVMWDGWVTPDHPRIHISGHWNYPEGTKRTVYVVANTPEVELKLNGHSLGRQTPTHDFLFTFPNVQYRPGVLEATAFDAHGKAVAQTKLETAGAPTQIRLNLHTAPGGMHADGSDLALVDVEVLDADGRRVPTALNMIHFHLSGPAEWRGGIAQGSAVPVPLNTTPVVSAGMAATPVATHLHDDNYILSPNLPVEGGVNRVSVRSTRTPGILQLVAESDGLTPAHIEWHSQPIPSVEDGLSTFNPETALPLQLGRGPTPAGASYVVTRRDVPIAGATAGANPGEAAKSYDDNETTSWSNASLNPDNIDSDGLPMKHVEADPRPIHASLADAWIEYTLAAPVSPVSIDLKLGSFRVRRYPLRITLDGQEVYEGVTPTSLGYVTLPLKAVRPGAKLRITLTADPADVQEAHALVEVNGRIDQAEPQGKAAKPILTILEAEVFTRP